MLTQDQMLRPVLVLFSTFTLILGMTEPDYRCTSDKDCDKFSYSSVCCVQASCNDAYRYYRFTSGCTKKNHCEPDMRFNAENGQFSARMSYKLWEPIRDSLATNNNCSVVQQRSERTIKQRAPQEFIQVPATPPSAERVDATGRLSILSTSMGGNFVIKDEYCNAKAESICKKDGKFCCVKVTCPGKEIDDYTLEEVCVLPGGCGLKEVNGRYLPQHRLFEKILWAPGKVWSKNDREIFLNTVYRNKNLPLIGSCSESQVYFDWLVQMAKRQTVS